MRAAVRSRDVAVVVSLLLLGSGVGLPSAAAASTGFPGLVSASAKPAPAAVPAPTVTPGEIVAGGIVTVSGVKCTSTGSGPTGADVSLVTATGSVLVSGAATPTASGAWHVQFTVPPSTAAGSYDIDSTCDRYTSQIVYPVVSLTVDPSVSTWAVQDTVSPLDRAGNGLFNAVSCTTPASCVAVGSYVDGAGDQVVLAEVWNGTKWAVSATPNPSGTANALLTGVSCAAANACTAVGYYSDGYGQQTPLAEVWNGAAWSIKPLAHPTGASSAQLNAVSCTASNACRAVGSYQDSANGDLTLVEVWNGTKWAVTSTPNPTGTADVQLTGVSCAAANACTAVGYYYSNSSVQQVPLAEMWNGARWSIKPPAHPTGASSAVLTAVSCTASNVCTAVGYDSKSSLQEFPLAEMWNGTTWSVKSPANPTGASIALLNAVSCTASNACTAVGFDFDSTFTQVVLVEVWNGTKWVHNSAANSAGSVPQTNAVSCTASNACAAVGNAYVFQGFHQEPLVEAWNGTAWTVQSTPRLIGATTTGLNGVSCTTASACVAVGSSTSSASEVALVQAWNGQAWAVQSIPKPTGARTSAFSAVSCSGSTACVAVGSYYNRSYQQRPLAEVWNGTNWVSEPPANPAGASSAQLNAVSCTASTACTAVGSYTNAASRQVPLAEEWNGTAWAIRSTSPPSAAVSSQLNGVSCTTPTTCTAVGSSTNATPTEVPLVEVWNGTVWAAQSAALPSGSVASQLNGVSCSTSTACTAVGSYYRNDPSLAVTLAEKWNGTKWVVQPSANGTIGGSLSGVSCVRANACTAVGQASDYGFGNDSGLSVSLAEVWNGSAWTAQSTPSATGNYSQFSGVSCVSVTACVAAGSQDRALQVSLVEAEGGA